MAEMQGIRWARAAVPKSVHVEDPESVGLRLGSGWLGS